MTISLSRSGQEAGVAAKAPRGRPQHNAARGHGSEDKRGQNRLVCENSACICIQDAARRLVSVQSSSSGRLATGACS